MKKLKAVFRQTRWLLLTATILLASPFLLPLWQIRMEAPQYKGEEALTVSVYANSVIGDLKEIDILNQYVGVRLPLEGVEITLLPFVFGGLVVVAAVAALLPMRWHRLMAGLLVVLLLVVGVGGMGVLQYRLWEMGHDRGEEIFQGVDDFTPPVVGSIHVANFDASMRIGLAGWCLLLAAGLGTGVALSRPDGPSDSAKAKIVPGVRPTGELA